MSLWQTNLKGPAGEGSRLHLDGPFQITRRWDRASSDSSSHSLVIVVQIAAGQGEKGFLGKPASL